MSDIVTREMKPRQFGTVAEMFKRSITSAGGPKRLAAVAQRSLGRIYAYRDTDAERTPFDFVEALVRSGACEPVQHLAALAGGAFIPIQPRDETLAYSAARLLAEAADFAGGVMLDLEDGKLSATEARQRLQDVEQAMTSLATARRHLNRILENDK